MKIGEWDSLGRVRAILQRQMGDLGATELATHVTVGEEGRQRILVATDVGLLDYAWSPGGSGGTWLLRGQVYRWHNVQGLRLQTDATFDEANEPRSIWRLVVQEPKVELAAEAGPEAGDRALRGLLDFARACCIHAA